MNNEPVEQKAAQRSGSHWATWFMREVALPGMGTPHLSQDGVEGLRDEDRESADVKTGLDWFCYAPETRTSISGQRVQTG